MRSLQCKFSSGGSQLAIWLYVIGDEAFVCTNNFLMPYSGHRLGTWKDAFNFYLFSMRQCVERSFVLLVQCWGILWHPLQFDFSCWIKVLMALAKLHNFCIDETDIQVRQWFHEDVLEGDQFDVITNEVFLDEDEQSFLTTYWIGHWHHNNLRALLEEKGLCRPNYNIKSRA